MKQILILMCIFLNGCVDPWGGGYYDEVEYEHKTALYEFSTSNDYATNFIDVHMDYELPEHRAKDFIKTLSIILNTPELKNTVYIQFLHYSYDGLTFDAYLGRDETIVADNNSDFDLLLSDPLDVNYYSLVLTYKEVWFDIENTVQIHMRQNSDAPETIRYMVMVKPHNSDEYKYLKHTMLNKLTTTVFNHEGIPLPDILK